MRSQPEIVLFKVGTRFMRVACCVDDATQQLVTQAAQLTHDQTIFQAWRTLKDPPLLNCLREVRQQLPEIVVQSNATNLRGCGGRYTTT